MRKPQLLLLTVGFLSCLAALGFAAFVHRPLFSDGAYWYFNVLQKHRMYYDYNYDRFLDPVLLQLPALALMHLFPAKSFEIGFRALDVAYSLHPMLSLLVCAAILWRKRRMELLCFPLLSYAWATQPTIGFHAGVVPVSLSLFWPLFLLTTLNERFSRATILWILALTAGMAFLYEAGILLLALVFFACAIHLKKDPRGGAICGFLSGAAILFLLYRLLGPTTGTKVHFFESLKRGTGPYSLYSGIMASALALYYGARWVAERLYARNPSVRRLALWTERLMLLCGIGAFIWVLHEFFTPELAWKFSLWDSFDSRIWAAPFAFLIASSLFLSLALKNDRFRGKWLPFVAFAALSFAAVFDAHTSLEFRAGLAQARALAISHPGCQKITRKDWDKSWVGHGMTDWTIPFVSALLQPRGRVSSVIFTERQPGSFEKHDPCQVETGVLGNKVLKNDYGFEFPLQSTGSFDYSSLERKLAR